MKDKIFSLIWNILASGLSKDSDIEKLRRIVLVNFFYSLASFFLFTFSFINLLEKDYLFVIVDVVMGILMIGLMLWLRKIRDPKYPCAIGIFIAVTFFLFLTISSSKDDNMFVWGLILPLVSIFLLGNKKGILITIFYLFLVIAFLMGGYFYRGEPLIPFTIAIRNISVYLIIMLYAIMMEKAREVVQRRLISANKDLEKSFYEIKTLSGLLPICYKCKKVRDDKGYWDKIENYITMNSDAQFTHTLCSDCSEEEYGNEEWFKKYKEKKSKENK